MCSCTSLLEGWFSLFLNKGLLPSSASSCIDSASSPSTSSIGALSSSTGANVGLTEPVPIIVSRAGAGPQRPTSIASAGLFTHKSSIDTLRSRRRFVICPVLLFLTKALSSPKVDLISSLCDLGNAQERTLHWANFPDDPAALSFIRSAGHRRFASRRDGISSCALGRSSLTFRKNWA